jgi:thiazole synthase
MGEAFRKAVEAGRAAYEIGLPQSHAEAVATSPLSAFFTSSV